MLTRALIVLLVLLNASVALWWILRDVPVVHAPRPSPSGVAELQLLGADALPPPPRTAATGHALQDVSRDAAQAEAEAPADAATVVPAEAATGPTGASTAVPGIPASPAAVEPRCVSLGPFPDAAAARAAQARLGSRLQAGRTQEQAPSPDAATRYRVMLPAAASRAEAQATVQRIVAAGLGDHYLIAQGPETNAIALGQYRNRDGAERRLAAVQTAGFPARLQPSAAATWWLQGILADGHSVADLRRHAGAASQRSLDCARLR